MLKKTLKFAGVGFLLGAAIGNLIAVLTGHSSIVSEMLVDWTGSMTAALVVQTVLSGLIGAAGMGGVSLYDAERLPLLAAAVLHFILYFSVFSAACLVLGWFSDLTEFLVMAAIMAGIHILIFLIMCAVYRKEVRKLNKMQENRLQKQEGKQ